MARLPGDRYLIQQIGGQVILFERYTEREIVRTGTLGDEIAKAQQVIHESPDLTDEEKCFAHFWCGYFYAHAAGVPVAQA
jgi:hypothetical protein